MLLNITAVTKTEGDSVIIKAIPYQTRSYREAFGLGFFTDFPRRNARNMEQVSLELTSQIMM